MIDFHSHILPGVDDGSKDYNESIGLLKEAKDAGFDKIISTSHYAVNCYEIPEYKRKELIEELLQEDEDFPEIILGSEIYLSYNIVDLIKEYNASTINGTNYILFELPLKDTFMDLKNMIIKMQEAGYRLVLAHPERYSFVQKDFKNLYKLQESGVIFQSNYGSILGFYGGAAKRTVKRMFKEGLVSLLGTDVHKTNSIYPKVDKALQKIAKYYSEEAIEDITTNNPQAILNGEEI